VDLDSQDDLRNSNAKGIADSIHKPQPVPWQVIYDSWREVAKDIVRWRELGRPGNESKDPLDLGHWSKVFANAEEVARKRKLPDASPAEIFASPEINGFGPWDNAWLLAKSTDPATPNRYVIAIRGTIFSNAPSAIEDAFTQPVLARDFLVKGFSFADEPGAAVHSGMAHGAYSLVRDSRYGILAQLAKSGVPPGSLLYIVGHSQGAGIATLIHALLGNMMRAADAGGPDPLELRGKGWRLKSYAIAQPKIGNHLFAAEFAKYTQHDDTAIVINNNIDPVPLVPLTFTQVADVGDVFTGKDRIAAWLHRIGSIGVFASGLFSRAAEPRLRESAAGYGYYYKWNPDTQVDVDQQFAWSWNFQAVGRVIYVYGDPNANPSDDFFQHHATTYRVLVEQQLGSSMQGQGGGSQ
jgi:hypothetical protein